MFLMLLAPPALTPASSMLLPLGIECKGPVCGAYTCSEGREPGLRVQPWLCLSGGRTERDPGHCHRWASELCHHSGDDGREVGGSYFPLRTR